MAIIEKTMNSTIVETAHPQVLRRNASHETTAEMRPMPKKMDRMMSGFIRNLIPLTYNMIRRAKIECSSICAAKNHDKFLHLPVQ